MNKIRLLNSFLSTGTKAEFLESLAHLAKSRQSSYVCLSNVHMVIEAHRDEKFNSVLNNADIAAPDGMPVARCLSWFYGLKQERIAGMDLFPLLMKTAENFGLSVYFFGSTNEVIAKVVQRATDDFPRLKICGYYSPPFTPLTQGEKDRIAGEINRHKPNFVFASLGCPKQEKWMAEHKGKIHSCMIGVGGAFSVFAGYQKRAPRWMQLACVEWLYRLFQEPRRLWKRYMYTNLYFIVLISGFYVRNVLMKSLYTFR